MIMSANDVIYLDLKNFTVQHTDVENLNGNIKKYKTLKKALTEAKKIQDEYDVEYGIFITQGLKNE
jgi:hypothetical protein